MRATHRNVLGPVLVAMATVAGCNNSSSTCAAPTTGTFTLSLAYAETIPVALYCDGSVGDASACAARPHALAGATWSVVVNGSTAMVSGSGIPQLTCEVVAPESAPSSGPGGGTIEGSGCYLLVSCPHVALGDAGAMNVGNVSDVMIQLLAPSSSDVLVLTHEQGADCCTDQYSGTWR